MLVDASDSSALARQQQGADLARWRGGRQGTPAGHPRGARGARVNRSGQRGDAGRSGDAGGPTVVVCVALLRDGPGGRCVLAARRAYPARLRGLWELPGGKVEPGESETDAVVREVREELGTGVRVIGRYGPQVQVPGAVLRMYLAEAEGEPVPHEHEQLRWLDSGRLDSVPWLPGDGPLVDALRGLLAASESPIG